MVVDDKNENKQIEAGIGTFFYKKNATYGYSPIRGRPIFTKLQISQS